MLYDLFSLDISVALCRDNRSGYHYRLDGQSSARQDDGMDIGLLLHPLCGYHLLFLLRTEYPQGTAYQRPQHGPAHQALHARVRRTGESSPARQQ